MNPKLKQKFQHYEEFHQTKLNKMTHLVGIPLIVFSSVLLLSNIPLLAEILILLISFYYIQLSTKLGFIAFITFFLNLLVAKFITNDFVFAFTLFILGWIFQFIGHFIFEKKSPAFLKNLEHLLIGPLWCINFSLDFYFKKEKKNV